MTQDRIPAKSKTVFWGSKSHTQQDVNNGPHSLGYEGTRGEMSVAGACTHPV